MNFPEDLELLKDKITQILAPICSTFDKGTSAPSNFLISAERTDAGRSLPEYYLCYFLFVDLLQYRNLGQHEKISWSVPIDYNGKAFLLEHRKLGMGLFVDNASSLELESEQIVKKVHKAVRAARPYFEWRAEEAAKRSDLNVFNHSLKLLDRYSYFIDSFKDKTEEASRRKDDVIELEKPEGCKLVSYPSTRLRREANWLAISAIDAFFSFSEHIFIHAAILKGNIFTGDQVANLIDNSDWAEKFKSAIGISDPHIKGIYDQLVGIKRQVRNFLAHGAFGKNGEAFQIHSGAGAVPLLMPHKKGRSRFSIEPDLSFEESEALRLIDKFLKLYWDSNSYPEVIYIKSGLPTILTYAQDSTYSRAMNSVDEMSSYVEHLTHLFERSANMDW